MFCLQQDLIQLLCWTVDWSVVDPMDYLTPFMEVIRSPETSGPITGAALTAVSRFLDAYVIGKRTHNVCLHVMS